MNFAEFLVRSASEVGERVAIEADGTAVTYADLLDRAARVASLIHGAGVEPGDVVAVKLLNGVDLPACFFGALLAGAVVTTVNPLLRPAEVARLLADAGATLLLDEGGSDGHGVRTVSPAAAASERPLDGPVPRSADDAAVLVYSSGTTGHPKAAEMTHGNIEAASAGVLDAIGGCPDPPAVLCGAPFFQGFGQGCGMNAMLRAGASVFTFSRWDAPRALELLERHRIPMLQAVPTMCHDLLELPRRDTGGLRLCLTGGAAMPVDLLRRFERELGCEVLEGYGLTEAYRVAMGRPGRRKPGSIGAPLRGIEIRIVSGTGSPEAAGGRPGSPGEPGELWIRGPSVMRGYWRKPQATAEVIRDGWLRTRDIVRRDEDGDLYVIGRVDDMIIRGGYNVHPSEVEQILREHPSVADAAVVPVPDERLGSEVGAAVVPAPGCEIDPDELTQFVRSRIAPYKYPRLIWTVPDLPRGLTGKVLRRQVTPPRATAVS